MVRRIALAALCAAGMAGTACAQDARQVIAAAEAALGNVDSIAYSGSARYVSFQQCGANAGDLLCYGTHDPTRPIHAYERIIDLDAMTSRHAGDTLNIGPGGSTAVSPGRFFEQVTSAQADTAGPWGEALELYLTPWGFLKGAAQHNATLGSAVMDAHQYTTLSWSPRVRAPSGHAYVINGYLDADNRVAMVETWLGENIMGDMHIVATYSNYRDWDGFWAPTEIVQTRGGWPFFEARVTAAVVNPADAAAIAPAPEPAPRGGGGGGARAMEVSVEDLGGGLVRFTTGGGSYDSLIYEFDDHLIMFEAGQSQARAEAYVAEARRRYPDKPIRYVVNTHPHSDHTGGLPVLIAEGAALVTHANNVAFLDGALNTPRTLLDDALSRNPQRAHVIGIGDSYVMQEGDKRAELYHIWPAPHSNGLIVAYFPEQSILFQGDFSLPAPGQRGNDHVQALVPALEALGVTEFERYINVHAPAEPQTRDELWAAADR